MTEAVARRWWMLLCFSFVHLMATIGVFCLDLSRCWMTEVEHDLECGCLNEFTAFLFSPLVWFSLSDSDLTWWVVVLNSLLVGAMVLGIVSVASHVRREMGEQP